MKITEKVHWFLKSATLKNAKYIVQAFLRKHLVSQEVQRMMIEHKGRQCGDCLAAGQCVVCGCDTIELFRSDKPCSYYGTWFARPDELVDTQTKKNKAI